MSADAGEPDGTVQSWKVSLPCTRAEGEALASIADPLPDLDPAPVIMTSEPDPARPEEWRLDAYFEGEPDTAAIAAVAALAPSFAGTPAIGPVAEADWLTMSQAGLEPIRAGRFFVHTAAHADKVPADAVAFRIEAGRAFGTGQHETTTGCLVMLDRMRAQGALFGNIVDVGTGTGLLAFAAMHLWPHARALATDIDPVSIEVTQDNAAANGIALGHGPGRLGLVVADGMDHPLIAELGPYDLVIANILAQPLIELAPAIAAALDPGGSLILAGLLDRQADAVIAAYRRQGVRLADRAVRGDWPTLHLRKRRSY